MSVRMSVGGAVKGAVCALQNPAARLVERNLSQFDIRAWVLVTSWNPLTVWMYEPYIRICTEAHSLDPKGLGNAFQHLCNRYAETENPLPSPTSPLSPGIAHQHGCDWRVRLVRGEGRGVST